MPDQEVPFAMVASVDIERDLKMSQSASRGCGDPIYRLRSRERAADCIGFSFEFGFYLPREFENDL